MMYNLSRNSLLNNSSDIVFLAKKWSILDYKNELSRKSIERDTEFLLRNIEKSSR